MTDLLAILALLGGLQGAQAQPVPRIHYDGPPAIHRPQPRTGSVPLPAFNVTYHGGPVQNGPNSYAIYWFPSRGSTFNAYVAGIDRYLSDAGRAPLYDVPASYSTAANPIGATKFAQAYVDGHPFPGTLNEAVLSILARGGAAGFRERSTRLRHARVHEFSRQRREPARLCDRSVRDRAGVRDECRERGRQDAEPHARCR